MKALTDYLSVSDLDGATFTALLDRADELKRLRLARLAGGGSVIDDVLDGRTVALIFEKPSLRTRASFEIAVHELGGHALPMWDFEVGLGRRESIADTARVLSGYVSAIVIRTFGQERIAELAAHATVPVVNALTDHEHPCQALADLQCFREHVGGLAGHKLAYVGDGNNVAHSLLLAGALTGLDVTVGHPEGYAPDAGVVARAQQLAVVTGATIATTTDPITAVAGADAVYTDVWASMGQEAEAEERRVRFAPFQVNAGLMAAAGPDAILLHCLPAHRDEEVAADVIDDPRTVVFDQAENRLHAQKALLEHLLVGSPT